MLSTLPFYLYLNDLADCLKKESNTEEDQPQTPKLDNIAINNSLFADDLTILSWSKYDLQKNLSNLENYSEKWGLELNLDKTKVMIFNKQGSTVKKHKFCFPRRQIEIVEQYTYLGFTFITSGKKHKVIEIFCRRGQKHGLQFKDYYLN